jgi:hypothetical protein
LKRPVSLSTALARIEHPVVQGVRAAAAALPPLPVSRPIPVARPEEPHSLLLAAKALVFCGFPLQPSPLTSIAREAQLGAGTHLTVYFSTTEPGVPIPYGADRALLAWITTLTYDTGFVTFTSLTDFFEAFQLARSGVQYQRFEQRLQRLLSLSLSVVLKTPTGTVRLNMRPPAFHEYLRDNPVVLPLMLMRRFHARPLFWDAASYLLYRCWSARTKSRITWNQVRRQLASVDQHDRRLVQSLNRVAEEIRLDYPNFPAVVEAGTHDLIVAPFRPPEEHFRP